MLTNTSDVPVSGPILRGLRGPRTASKPPAQNELHSGAQVQDTAPDERDEARHRERPVEHEPGVQTLLTHEVAEEWRET